MILSIDEFMRNVKLYPDDEILINGLKDDDIFINVDSYYLNGFINHVEIVASFMIRAHKMPKSFHSRETIHTSWESACNNVDNLKDFFHTDLSNKDMFDDVCILAKSRNSYIFFRNRPQDPQSCHIGRFSTSSYESDNQAIEGLREYCIRKCESGHVLFRHLNPVDTYMKEIPIEYFTGWITL